jgi:uncharacterized protein (TIRG00374 family)
MDDQLKALRQFFSINRLIGKLLPVVCLGVLANLVIAWFATDRQNAFDLQAFSWKYLLVAALLSLLPWFWHAVRLAVWSRFFGIRILGVDLLRIVVATDVGGAVTPTAVGGAPVKLAMLIQQGYSPGKAVTLTLLGNFEDVLFFTIAIPISLLLTRPWEHPIWMRAVVLWNDNSGVAAIIVSMLALLLYLFSRSALCKRIGVKALPWWRQTGTEFSEAARLILSKGRRPFFLSMFVLMLQWSTRFSILIAVLLALGLPNDLLHIFLLQWMVFIAMLFVPTPGAAGGAEAAFFLVFGKMIPGGIIGIVLAGWRFLTYYFMLLAGVAILWATRERKAAVL